MAWSKEGVTTTLCFCCVVNAICVLVYVFGSYRRIHSKGAYYDVAFGVETSLNLLSDFTLIGTLQDDAISKTDVLPTADVLKRLSAFLIWNTGSTLFCYVGHIAASKFASKYERIEKLDTDTDEDSYRRSTFINGIIMYTVIATVKAYVLYGIYTFYVECKRTGTMPTVMEGAMFLNAPGGSTAGGQEPVIIIIRQTSATSVDPGTGGRSLTTVREVVRVSDAHMAFPGTSTASKKEAKAAHHPTKGKRGPSEEKPQKRSSEESSFGASHRQSHSQSFEVPEVVFPAIRPSDGAVAGPSRPRRGGAR